MRLGVAVIATDVGAVNELVGHGENGLLIANGPAAADDCVYWLEKLAGDRVMLRRLAAAGTVTATARDWHTACREFIAFLDDLVPAAAKGLSSIEKRARPELARLALAPPGAIA
jgi:glycosyltransferase involved in cell wall biosynthesis